MYHNILAKGPERRLLRFSMKPDFKDLQKMQISDKSSNSFAVEIQPTT